MSILHKHFLHSGDYNPDQWLDRPDILLQDAGQIRDRSYGSRGNQ